MADERFITTYPTPWTEWIDDLSEPATLEVAGYATDVEVTRDQLDRVYFPLLSHLLDSDQGTHRVLASLAGIPGSGKSTFAATLAHVARHLLPPETFVVVGMDGWHWPNDFLDRQTTTDGDGNVIPLRKRKGGPQSFDVAALANALLALHAGDRPVSLPVYDRQRHDPISDALTITPETRIVLVEGNYLLSIEPPWEYVSGQFRPKLFLVCDRATARERITARHVRGGATPEQANAKYEENDRMSVQAVLRTAENADLRIRLTPEPTLSPKADSC